MIGILLSLLTGTTPERVGPFGITAFFIIVLLISVLTVRLITSLFFSRPMSAVLRWVLSFCLTGYLALGTVEVGLGDSVLLLMLIAVSGFYWARIYRPQA